MAIEMQRRAMYVGPSRAELVAVLESEKERDPLGRVLILVPNMATAETVRVDLAIGRALLNVHIRTIEGAAEELIETRGVELPPGADRLLMQRLITSSPAGRPFVHLSTSPGFLSALAGTLRDIIDAGLHGAGLDAPAEASAGLCDLLALARAYETFRAELALDDDSARFIRATERIKSSDALTDCVLLFGLYDATGLQEEFLVALLLSATRAHVFLPGHAFSTGFRTRLAVALEVEPIKVDHTARTGQLGRLRAAWDAEDLEASAGEVGGAPHDDGSVRVFSMPGGEVGAELLARHVARLLDENETLASSDVELLSRGSGGIPGEAVARELVRLGVQVNRGRGAFGATAVGRVLIALGSILDAPRVTRHRVMDLIHDMPWRPGGLAFGQPGLVREVNAVERALWDKLGRVAQLRVLIDTDSSTVEARKLFLRTVEEDDRQAAHAFLGWVDQLASLHSWIRSKGVSQSSWAELGKRLTGFLEDWIDEKSEGLREWKQRLSTLGRIDVLGMAPNSTGLNWLIRGWKDEVFSHNGVRIGKLAGRRGARARHVFLLDGDEGSFPRSRSQNILLSDADRRLLASRAPGLAVELDSVGEERALFAELCSVAQESLVLVTTHNGIDGKGAAPSRWVIESLGILLGDRLRCAPSSEMLLDAKIVVPGLVRFELEDSWRRGVSVRPPGTREGILFALDDALRAGISPACARDVVRDARVTPDAAGEAESARRSAPGMSAWDGQLSPDVAACLSRGGAFRGTPKRGLSVSRLEAFATCGMRSLLSAILGVKEHGMLGENRGILAVERGTRVHEILERFGRTAKKAGHEPWSSAPLEALETCLFDTIEAVVAQARSASPEDRADLWEAEAARYRGLLLGWLRAQRRDRGDWVPSEFEWRFDAVRLDLDQGPPIYLRGVADRVDLSQPAGEGGGIEVRVVDYKTGSGGDAKDESTHFGQSLQLALYGVAARKQFGAATSSGLFDFVFFGKTIAWTGRGEQPNKGAWWRRETDATTLSEVRLLVESMEAGQFWPTPRKNGRSDDYGCKHCGVREACGPWRTDALELAAERDPLLANLRELMENGGLE